MGANHYSFAGAIWFAALTISSANVSGCALNEVGVEPMASRVGEDRDVMVSGVWFKGAQVSDPQPASSKYFKVYQGGFKASSKGAWYWLLADIISDVPVDLWVRVECDNPLDPNSPFVEEGPVQANSKSFSYASHNVKGLRMYETYELKVTLHESKEKNEVLDEFTQRIKAYVDTSGQVVGISKGMASQ